MATALICMILFVICLIGIRSYCRKLTHGCCGGEQSDSVLPPQELNGVSYPFVKRIEIGGMTCENCGIRIQNAFHKRKGFYVELDWKKGRALVKTKEPVTDQQLREIVERAGYRVITIEIET